MKDNDTLLDCDVLVIGAGFSGLGALIRLRQAGCLVIVLEKENSLGGTWRDNTYPGCACDVQSHLYSYSFYPNPDWSQSYAPWYEINNYLNNCCDHFNVRKHIQFNQCLVKAEFDETHQMWRATTKSGKTFCSRFLLLGLGLLTRPHRPDIKGLDQFTGPVIHSNSWNHELDFSGKNVVNIGTGASAIQYLPEIAKQAKKLAIFQRTAPWVLPKINRRYPRLVKEFFRGLPLINRLYRYFIYWLNESRVRPFLRVKYVKPIEKLATFYIKKCIKDKQLQKKLMPNYLIGCKRILLSSDYYPMYNRENVALVQEPIIEIKENQVVSNDGQRFPVDIIVLGTGFLADPKLKSQQLDIKGRGGKSLKDCWQHQAQAYLGTTISGFPNLFYMVGPNAGLGHNSVVFIIEAQLHYIAQCIKLVKDRDARTIEVNADQFKAYNEQLAKRFKNTVWVSGCRSWYQDESGHNFAIWPDSSWSFWRHTRAVAVEDYIIG